MIDESKGGRPSWPESEMAIVRRMYALGISSREIGKAIGRSMEAVRSKTARLGMKRDKPVILTVWNPDRIEEMKRLVDSGMTTQEVANEMRLSRSSIVGAMSKHGVRSRSHEILRRRAPKPNPKLPQKPVEAVKPKPVPTIAHTTTMGLQRPLESLKLMDCRWIVKGSGEGSLYCAETKREGSSYCAHHHAMAYKPTVPGVRKSSDRDTVRRQQWSM